jgi:predicted permease
LINHFNPAVQVFWWVYPFINIGLALSGLLIARACVGICHQQQPREWMAVSSLHNGGYIPMLFITMLPIGESQVLYPYVILSIIGFDICLWSLGVWLIAYRQKAVINWRNFINPPLVAMAIAFMIVLLGLKNFLPEIVLKPMKIIGDCALGLAMLTIGGNLALTSFNQLRWKEVSGVVLIKLMILPVLALIFLRFVPQDPTFSFILMIQACMPTSITLSIIARNSNNVSQDFINQAIFITHLLCILTIPLFLGLYGKLIH